jgi:hypothetical protein
MVVRYVDPGAAGVQVEAVGEVIVSISVGVGRSQCRDLAAAVVTDSQFQVGVLLVVKLQITAPPNVAFIPTIRRGPLPKSPRARASMVCPEVS